ncbi:MAG: WcbI family polysaccharide biosynthesis putative acetyltransferase [Bryobacteraceae bacterium]|nr:WcbI family polysaccharide biosynthesis putative acetyltransferase [Bryobacteraceae bacterium]
MAKIVIIGNCQAQFLEGLFSTAGTLEVDRVPPNFELTETARDALLGKLAAASAIFIQRTSDDFGLEWLRSSSVAAAHAGKVLVWPNIYFDGYFPNTRYVYLNKWGKLQSPLEDYHLTPVLEAWKAGQTVEQATSRLKEAPCGTPDPFEASLGHLRDREKDCTVLISDHMETAVHLSKCFYTPNHPHTPLLVEMARRLATAADIPFDTAKAASWSYHLDRIDLPVFDWVVKRYQLGFGPPGLYKGRSVEKIGDYRLSLGETKYYTSEEVVDAFYRVYQAAL